MLGRRFADLDILELLGIGGAAEVYRAVDLRRGKVAVKILSQNAEPEMVRRFLREGQAMSGLRHPHILQVHEMGEYEGTRYIILELATGGSLRDRLQRDKLCWREAVQIGIQLAAALQYAHDQGIFHRDVKPGNVMFDAAGNAKLMDFGLAHVSAAPSMTRTGTVMGTVLYLSPEQAVGQHVDHRSDLYALGAVLFEMMTGEPPFTGPSAVSVIYKHLNEQPHRLRDTNPEIPPMLDGVVDRLLKKDASRRYQSAGALIAALETVLQDEEQQPAEMVAAITEGEAPEPPIVGREGELETLLQQVDRAISGIGNTVILTGEAGIGKSRLTRELTRQARSKNVLALAGVCLYADAPNPYAPVFEMLESYEDQQRYSTIPDTDQLSQEIAELLQDIRTVFVVERTGSGSPNQRGERLEWLGLASPTEAQTQAFELLIRFFALASRQRPLLLILDDVQWASPTLLQLFHYLARSLGHTRILLLGAHRTEDVLQTAEGGTHPLTETLRRMSREHLYQEIRLEPLGSSEASALILQTCNQANLASDFIELVQRECEGNPFYLLETLRLLQAQGVLHHVGDRWELSATPDQVTLPDTVLDLIMRRIERVAPEERDLLDWGAVLGQRLDISILAPLAGSSRLALLRLLHAIERNHALLVSDDAGFQFAHNKIRQALYAEMPPSLRRECHLMIAETVEQVADGQEQRYVYDLARHYVQGGEHVKGYRYSVLAAQTAERAYAFSEALAFYDQALTLLGETDAPGGMPTGQDRDEQELELRHRYAQLLLTTGEIEASQKSLALCLNLSRSLGVQTAEADILLDLGVSKGRLGSWSEALELADQSRAIAHKVDDAERAATSLLRSGFFAFEQGSWEQATTRLETGLTLAREQGNELLQARFLGNLAIVQHVQGQLEKAIALYRKNIDTFERLGSPMDVGRGYSNMGFSYQRMGDLVQAETAFRRALDSFKQVGEVREEGVAYLHLAEVALGRNDLALAREHCSMATQLFERVGFELGVADVHRVHAGIAGQEGRWAVAERYLGQALTIYGDHGDSLNIAETNEELGHLMQQIGQEQKAREALERSRTIFDELQGPGSHSEQN